MIGTEAVREAVSGDATASVRERPAKGKHRTEVTEATEGDDWDGGCEGTGKGDADVLLPKLLTPEF
jgi:hypothetical protein